MTQLPCLSLKIRKLISAVCLLVFTSRGLVAGNSSDTKSELETRYEALKRHKIIPDVLHPDSPPLKLHLQVAYGGNIVRYGTELYSLQIEKPPFVGWKGEKNVFYSLVVVGPDMPSYADPFERNWLHWAIGNIPSGNASLGQVITPYDGLNLGYELGPHRMVFLVYEQPKKKKLKFMEADFTDKLDFFRRGFYNPYVFQERYNLTGPIAANFLIGLWENEIHQAGSIYGD